MRTSFIPAAGLAWLLSGCVSGSSSQDEPPQIAGQTVPDENIVLDFARRFNLVCRDGSSSLRVTNCRILGYTGESVRDASGSVSGKYAGHFGRWLVVELADGRRACMDPGSIRYLEEAAR